MTESQPMGFVDRIKSAASVIMQGKMPNPLAQEPKDKPRAALVQELQEWVREEREFWQPTFKRIRDEQKFAGGKQWIGDETASEWFDERFKGDVIQQLINRKVASLYAKNPTPEAKARERMNFEVWDERQESIDGANAILQAATPILEQASQAMQAGMQPNAEPPPEIEMAQAIKRDYEAGMAEKALYAKIARTASLLLSQIWDSQSPDFLVSVKNLYVAQAIVSRVGYVKVMYRRDEKPMDATQSANINGLREQLNTLKQKLDALAQEMIEPDSAEAEETRLLLQEVTRQIESAEQPEFENEGVVYDFLPATSVIIDRKCRCLKEFVGARRICHEMLMNEDEAEAAYKINLKDSGAIKYDHSGKPQNESDKSDDDCGKVCVWTIEDKPTGLVYVLIDGVRDFIREPAPNLPAVNRFWSIVPLTLNVVVVEENDPAADVTIFPRSDVRLAMPMQRDINTAGQGLREHRVANRPAWAANGQYWKEGDLEKLSSPRNAHDVMRINLPPDGDINKHLVPLPTKPIDPAMYDPAPSNQAMMLATGVQPSNLGAQNPDETATGQAIAEGSRISTDSSNVDDVEFAISTVAQMTFEMCIQEMDVQTVKSLVGRGAVWPDISKQQIGGEIYLQIEAGSAGKPNQALEAAKAEKIGPMLASVMQAEGKSLVPLIKHYARILDSRIDVDELLQPSQLQAPSAPAMGAPTTPPGTGGPVPPGGMAKNTIPAGQPRPPSLPPQQRAQAVASAGG